MEETKPTEVKPIGYKMVFKGPSLLSMNPKGRIVNWYGDRQESARSAMKQRQLILHDFNLILIQEKPKCKPHHKKFKRWFNNKRREFINKHCRKKLKTL